LRFLFAAHPAIMGEVLGIVYRTIAMHPIKKAVTATVSGLTFQQLKYTAGSTIEFVDIASDSITP